MYKILKKEKLAEDTYLMQILAPDIARHAKAGQFVMIRIDESGERIPLTIADFDKKKITVIFIVAGKTTALLAKMRKNLDILDVAGPLGNPTCLADKKFVCLVGGGVGIAAIYPIAKAYAEEGNKIHCILGVRSKKYLFWKDKFEKIAEKVIIASDDGSIGVKGNVVDALKNIHKKHRYELVVAIGPTIMMKFVAKYTYQRVKTIVSLNTLMVDGIGMCGGCRIKYDGKVKFVCVDGPEFDAHKVNFDEILNRNASYLDEESHVCKLSKIKLSKIKLNKTKLNKTKLNKTKLNKTKLNKTKLKKKR
jgi:ferredoxin/flavodoxin---NADP+ reductase